MRTITTSVALLTVGATGAIAAARDRSDTPIYDAVATPIAEASGSSGGNPFSPAGPGPLYSSITSVGDGSNDWAFNNGGARTVNTATTFPPDNFIEDDYATTLVHHPSFQLVTFVFVGGVGNSYGGIAFFDFFDAGGNYVDGFGANFGQGGNFIWTMSIFDPAAHEVPAAGSIQAYGYALTGYYDPIDFTWFVDGDGGNIGSNVDLGGAEDGSADETVYAFEMHSWFPPIPAPGALALLGFAGLRTNRRRCDE